jgi:hypothetical protein
MEIYNDNDGCSITVYRGVFTLAIMFGIAVSINSFLENNKQYNYINPLFACFIVPVIIIVVFSIIIYKYRQNTSKILKKKVLELEKSNSNISSLNRELEKLRYCIKEKDEKLKNYEKCIKEKDELYELLQQRNNSSITRITSLYADFLTIEYDISQKYLKNKIRPARTEAKRIEELQCKTKKYIEQFNLMQYKYEELLNLFPELQNYADDFDSLKELENIRNVEQLQDEYDRVHNYITKEEYQKLSETERNQLALDKYINSPNKSNWQIGRDYELFVGYYFRRHLYYAVEQYGIEKKLDDLGCDIIARKDNSVFIIQCKRWKESRKIHEKHILQLYGTSVLLKRYYKGILAPSLFDLTVGCIFISTHEVTDKAKEIAKVLNVVIQTIEFKEFPRIKCNINNNGEKIYHLPFDQQYDRTKIENEGEFYASTVKEAEENGFRRAFRHNYNRNK